MAHHPINHRLHVPAVDRGGVQQRREQRLRAARPVRPLRASPHPPLRSSPARSTTPHPTTATQRPATSAAARPPGSLAYCRWGQTPTAFRPSRAGRRVARITSGFVDVDTTGPVCASTAGMITPLVFPDRGGPSSSTARSLRANRASPPVVSPRYTPPPARQQRSRTACSGSPTTAVAQPCASAWVSR